MLQRHTPARGRAAVAANREAIAVQSGFPRGRAGVATSPAVPMADVAEDSTDAVSDAGGVHVERLQCAGDPSWRIVYGGMDVQGQSVAGISTCISVKTNGTHLAFDMGSCPSFAVGAQFVFITHGHPDHCAGVVQHIARRGVWHTPRGAPSTRSFRPASRSQPWLGRSPPRTLCRPSWCHAWSKRWLRSER